MYAHCGALENALSLFTNEHQQNDLLWNCMIRVYTQLGQSKEALVLYDRMQRIGVRPDKVTFISVLDACGRHGALTEGKQMHDHIRHSEFEADVVLKTALIKMYGKCGSLEDARRVFDEMPLRDVIAWTALIAAYAQNREKRLVGQLFNQMQGEGLLPDKFTFVCILDACASHAELAEGKRLHALIWNSGVCLDVVMGTALLNMYGKSGSFNDAQRMFDRMLIRNVLSWTTMIAVYAQNGLFKEALMLFDKMQVEGVLPDKVAFVSVLDACAGQGALAEGERMHACIAEKTFMLDIILGNAIINMYSKCGSIVNARIMFGKMIQKDLVSWNAMIAMYAQHKQGNKALCFFDQMFWEGVIPDKFTFASILAMCGTHADLPEGKRMHARILYNGFESDTIVGTALVSMYGKCGNPCNAQRIFEKITNRDVISWNAVMVVCMQHGQVKEGFQFLDEMQSEGLMPDTSAFIGILAACASLVALPHGKKIHYHILNRGCELDVALGNVLMNMYGKSGSLEDACTVFLKMLERNVISWNNMITLYAMHGHAREALRLFYKMQQEGVNPDKVTFISIFAACSHAGLVDECYGYFASMTQNHGILLEMDHYVCLIDLLARAGRLDEAEKLIIGMPLQPTIVPFMALLAACRPQIDVERGEHIARHLLELHPENPASYVMLSNVYATADRNEHVVNALWWV